MNGGLNRGSGGSGDKKERGKKGKGVQGGVTILTALYKIYAFVLAERIRKEVEQKGIILENQTGLGKRWVQSIMFMY